MATKQSEADLCAGFVKWATTQGFTCYPEVSDYDLVLVPGPALIRTMGPRTGGLAPEGPDGLHRPWEAQDQVGVQAKLAANIAVLYQAVATPGPTHRLVLAPRITPEFQHLAGLLGVGTVSQDVGYRAWGQKKWRPAEDGFRVYGGRMKAFPGKGLWLPPVVPDIPAGAQSPRQLTKWRLEALKLCRLLRTRGWVCAADFKALGLSYQRWEHQWLRRAGRVTPGYVPVGATTSITRASIRFETIPFGREPLPDVGWTFPAGTQKALDEYIDRWYTETCSAAPQTVGAAPDERT